MLFRSPEDLKIALEEADEMGLDLPGLKLAHSLYKSLQDEGEFPTSEEDTFLSSHSIGWGDRGTQALLMALEKE